MVYITTDIKWLLSNRLENGKLFTPEEWMKSIVSAERKMAVYKKWVWYFIADASPIGVIYNKYKYKIKVRL